MTTTAIDVSYASRGAAEVAANSNAKKVNRLEKAMARQADQADKSSLVAIGIASCAGQRALSKLAAVMLPPKAVKYWVAFDIASVAIGGALAFTSDDNDAIAFGLGVGAGGMAGLVERGVDFFGDKVFTKMTSKRKRRADAAAEAAA